MLDIPEYKIANLTPQQCEKIKLLISKKSREQRKDNFKYFGLPVCIHCKIKDFRFYLTCHGLVCLDCCYE